MDVKGIPRKVAYTPLCPLMEYGKGAKRGKDRIGTGLT